MLQFAQVGVTTVVEGMTHQEDGSVASQQPVVYVPAQWLLNTSQSVSDCQSMVLMPTVIQWQMGGSENQVEGNQLTDKGVCDSQIVPGVSSSSEPTTVSSTPVSDENFGMDSDNLFASTALEGTTLGVDCVGDIPSLGEFTDETAFTQASVDDSDLIGGCGQTLPLTSESDGTAMFSVSDRIGDEGLPLRDVSLVQHGDMTPITSPRTFSPGPDSCADAEFMGGDPGGLGTSDDVVSGFYGTSDGFDPPPSTQSDILRL